VVRVSGTEPLIRVMTEGRDEALIRRIAEDTARVIEEKLGGA
jgi:phosphoglucosamine mutase